MTSRFLNGSTSLIAVDRAASEWRSGRPVHLMTDGTHRRLACVETLSADTLERLQSLAPQTLYLTQHRATALGLARHDVAITSARAWTLEQLHQLVGATRALADESMLGLEIEPAPAGLHAAWQLAKRIHLIPALLGSPSSRADDGLVEVDSRDIERHLREHTLELIEVADARVPIAVREDCRIALFRDVLGGVEHLAIILGDVSRLETVPVRLHSACLTGDLLASLRCDCGEQLRDAVGAIADGDGGVLLYLSQEGRGIGLANKLRAYALQDDGLDTLEADRHLGFAADERDFGCAAAMLDALGISRIELFTNNPSKLAALRDAGIEIVRRRALNASINAHNARYMQTKRARAGHL